MTEAAAPETPQLQSWQVEGKPDRVVVTQENFNDYVQDKLAPPTPAEPAPEGEDVDPNTNPDPETIAAQELAEIEAKKAADAAKAAEPKEGDTDGSKVYFRGKWVSKHDFGYRVHLKTEEAKAEAKAETDRLAKEAKEARELADKAAKERDELKAKYEPPPSLEVGEKPDPAKYTDIGKYSEDLEKWAVAKAKADDAKAAKEASTKAAQEAQIKRWNDAETALIAEVPDYQQRLANAPGAAIGVSNELRDAILDSEIGPKLRLHLAENPEVLQDLLKLPVGRMLKQVGKIEIELNSTKKAEPQKTTLAEVQMSRAPAPITPIRGGNPGSSLKVDEKGNFTGTFEEYKAQRDKLLKR